MTKDIVINPKFTTGKIALALSGGRDSMTLANAFLKAGANFFAVNFEHGIRGESSIKDSDFVANWCKQAGIELLSVRLDTPQYCRQKGLSVEQGARELRYAYFEELLSNGKCDRVALAHHADDQAETVLMRIFRGTGIRGLAAMSEDNGKYIRPLLSYSREDIDEYVEQNEIPYVDDETNSDETYTRNFVRATLEKVKQRFPSVCESIARLSRTAAENEDYIRSLMPPVEESEGDCVVDVKVLNNLPQPVKKRYIHAVCETIGVGQDIEERHLGCVFDLAECDNGKRIELPHGIIVYKEEGRLVFSRRARKKIDTTALFGAKASEILSFIPVAREEFEKEVGLKGVLFADCDKLPLHSQLRNPQVGDRIEKFGGGSKNLGDFLTDKKIPLRTREELIVCADGKDILFVAGLEISAKIAVDDKTENIVRIALNGK